MLLQTIDKVSTDMGICPDSIRKMIKENRIQAYKQDGFKRILIDIEELYDSFKPINEIEEEFDFEAFKI